ncbi:hypothetical protein B5F53_16005 [Blautia sp. An249]|uniref:CHAT domain-containing protein n=1 Tax=Blautia sp. An249 TaxID=1965603 RepID=UPI000B38F6F1|nr:CHAT domain-containing protein [Blautia sp. An249]OUO76752.1 hypothetical protein B5F53_16005 [Blautia sp. An249]
MNAKEEYEQITELIDAERERHLNRLITALAAVYQGENENTDAAEASDDDTRKRRDEENTAMTALLALRIKAECEGIRFHLSNHIRQMKEDIEKLISYVQSLEYEWEISDAVKSDAYDLLCSICSSEDRAIIDQSYVWNQRSIINKEITPEMCWLFMKVAQYLRNMNRISEAVSLLEDLCMFSRERDNPDHKELICRALTQICDDSPETTCRICRKEYSLFMNDTSLYSGDFFWFYGCALMSLMCVEDCLYAFEKCYQIRRKILGDNNYYTEVARREIAYCKFKLTDGSEGRADLKRFVDQSEAGFFNSEVDETQLQIQEARILYTLLRDFTDISDPVEYKKYLKIYEQLCQRYEYKGEYCINMRTAWNIRGGYYLNVGDYIRAESAFLNALRVNVTNEEKCGISRIRVQSNLLLVYHLQNDIKKAYPLAVELLKTIENEYAEEHIEESDVYRIYTLFLSIQVQALTTAEQEEIDNIKKLLEETYDRILSDGILDAPREQAGFFITCICYLIQQDSLSISEQRKFSSVLCKIEENEEVFDLAPMQMTMLYYYNALILYEIGEAQAEEYFRKTINNFDTNGLQHTQKAAIAQSYGTYLCRQGRFDAGHYYIQMALDKITAAWQQYVQYINDYRLLMILRPVQLNFFFCYAVIRQTENINTAYEQLLRFKALASLAGRERNRIIHGSCSNTELLGKIRRLQNAMAALESENIFRNVEKDYEKLSEQLRRAERDFAIQFPQGASFTEISLQAVQDKIPDNTAVVEYYGTVKSYGKTQAELNNSSENQLIFDVYITRKESGKCRMQRITIPDGMKILEDVRAFVISMQHISSGEATIDELDQIDGIRFRLYDAIIAPVLPAIEGYSTVYIAPDGELINLPFDLLYGEEKICLSDRHNCVKIECARDFLFGSDEISGSSGTLIVGDPEYEVRERGIEPEKTVKTEKDQQRIRNLDVNEISSLPFAKVESYRVSDRIGGELYTGAYAAKQVVLSASGYENIHIATHGYFDPDNTDASLYSSGLVFAGIKNWYQTGEISPLYGNGLLTADEVSRMDLSSTKLVVLSSCLSGMNDVQFNAGFYGMVSALSAAGVKYVISNLWSVNDLASAVFMDAFYYYYANGRNEPPVALSKARDYLKSVTIDELRRQGWFHPTTYQMLDMESRNFLYTLEQRNGKRKPFRNEAFWGGFTCYECY